MGKGERGQGVGTRGQWGVGTGKERMRGEGRGGRGQGGVGKGERRGEMGKGVGTMGSGQGKEEDEERGGKGTRGVGKGERWRGGRGKGHGDNGDWVRLKITKENERPKYIYSL